MLNTSSLGYRISTPKHILFLMSPKMKEEGKSYYEAPAITVVEVKIEGVVCHSPVNGGNSIDNWGNGGTTNDDIYM